MEMIDDSEKLNVGGKSADLRVEIVDKERIHNLDTIISVGYRVNSIRATQFRQWCTYVIRPFSLRGYIIDKKRMEIPMSMEDWAKRIDIILEAGGDVVLHDAGKVTAEFAKSFAESEFEKYRVIQDKLFCSDFDKFNNMLPFDDSDK